MDQYLEAKTIDVVSQCKSGTKVNAIFRKRLPSSRRTNSSLFHALGRIDLCHNYCRLWHKLNCWNNFDYTPCFVTMIDWKWILERKFRATREFKVGGLEFRAFMLERQFSFLRIRKSRVYECSSLHGDRDEIITGKDEDTQRINHALVKEEADVKRSHETKVDKSMPCCCRNILPRNA